MNFSAREFPALGSTGGAKDSHPTQAPLNPSAGAATTEEGGASLRPQSDLGTGARGGKLL